MVLAATAGCSLLHRHERRQRPLETYYPDVRCKLDKRVNRYVGQVATDKVARRAKFFTHTRASIRVTAAEAATLDHRAGRVALEIDAQGRVTRIFCS